MPPCRVSLLPFVLSLRPLNNYTLCSASPQFIDRTPSSKSPSRCDPCPGIEKRCRIRRITGVQDRFQDTRPIDARSEKCRVFIYSSVRAGKTRLPSDFQLATLIGAKTIIWPALPLRNRDTDHGLQTEDESPKTMASAQWPGASRQSRYRYEIRRWRRTNRLGQ